MVAARQGAECPDLVPVPVSKEVLYLWRWFGEIMQYRTTGLTWAEIAAWKNVTGNQLNDWEVSVLWAIDLVYRK